MSKRGESAMAYADPSHPQHRKPSWDMGDGARYCGMRLGGFRHWVETGLIPFVLVPGSNRNRFKPCDVIAATRLRRVPIKQ